MAVFPIEIDCTVTREGEDGDDINLDVTIRGWFDGKELDSFEILYADAALTPEELDEVVNTLIEEASFPAEQY